MCGICGIVAGASLEETHLQAMNQTLVHRGPDGYGIDAEAGLAMRRLAIIDVGGSEQPLYNEDKSATLVFNGEIYNYQTLRHTLQQQGHTFRTEGDGETIVHLYEQVGLDAPQHLRGQFAFAVWDANQRQLMLARDRFGQKPLYYYHGRYQGEPVFVFGSEIKALLAHPAVPKASAFSEGDTLALYLAYGYVPAPLTAFKGIYALPPAHRLILSADNTLTIEPYWHAPRFAPADANADENDYLEALRTHIDEATRLRMIADVPLGAFLSGGLDSSLIVALMQRASNQTVRTFSIGFEGDASFDETSYAQQVAQHLGTEHTAFTVTPDALALLPDLVRHHDQPFADSSAIPTFLVSQMTRQHVTVALTGDGGDELFAGYERFYAAQLVQKLGIVPRPLWAGLAGILGALPEGTGYYNVVKRARRFADGARQPLAHAYFDWVRLFNAEWVHDLAHSNDHAQAHFTRYLGDEHNLQGILYANMTSYLPDDLLIKADRCSMQASLEARAPFLDHVLAEYAATIPLNLKLKGRTTKYILKQASRGILPDSIIDRPKHGFGVPLGAWLRRDASQVRSMLLDDRRIIGAQIDRNAVQRLLEEHTQGKRDHGQRLWALLTLVQWHEITPIP
jgi:asparagine synthase (glutamine-hydrolysing)